MRNCYRLIALTLLVSTLGNITVLASTGTKLRVNGVMKEIPESISTRKGFIPLRWVAEQLGATEISWKEQMITIKIPDFLARHQYVNILSGLRNEKTDAYLLPERLQNLDFPEVGFDGNHSYIQQKPLTLNITSGAFTMPFALYDYKIINGTLFVDHNWLNTLFLANTKYEDAADTLDITYMTSEEIYNNIETLEKIIKPVTAEEAIALWIRGQQMRSGALQYIILSPQLKKEAMSKIESQGWVTGGSSPSLGKAKILDTKKIDDNTISYIIQYDEILSGALYNQFEETITVQKQSYLNEESWLIINVVNNNPYYSILG